MVVGFVVGVVVGLVVMAVVGGVVGRRWVDRVRRRGMARERLVFTSVLLAREQLRRGEVDGVGRQLDGIGLVAYTGWVELLGGAKLSALAELEREPCPGDEVVRGALGEFEEKLGGW